MNVGGDCNRNNSLFKSESLVALVTYHHRMEKLPLENK